MTEEDREYLAELNSEIIVYDGLDEALLGACCRFGQDPIAIYDYDKCVEIRMLDGSSYEEAVEFHEINTMGVWVGKNTPAFLMKSPSILSDDMRVIRDYLNLSEHATVRDIISEIDYIKNDMHARGMHSVAECFGAQIDDDPIEFIKDKLTTGFIKVQ